MTLTINSAGNNAFFTMRWQYYHSRPVVRDVSLLTSENWYVSSFSSLYRWRDLPPYDDGIYRSCYIRVVENVGLASEEYARKAGNTATRTSLHILIDDAPVQNCPSYVPDYRYGGYLGLSCSSYLDELVTSMIWDIQRKTFHGIYTGYSFCTCFFYRRTFDYPDDPDNLDKTIYFLRAYQDKEYTDIPSLEGSVNIPIQQKNEQPECSMYRVFSMDKQEDEDTNIDELLSLFTISCLLYSPTDSI